LYYFSSNELSKCTLEDKRKPGDSESFMMIALSDVELFKSLMELKMAGEYIDLHNDYECHNIIYDFEKGYLRLLFKGNKSLILEFSDVVIAKLNLQPQETSDRGTLNNFYRGRFEINGTLYETSEEGRKYFYLEIEAGGGLELYASDVFLFEEEEQIK